MVYVVAFPSVSNVCLGLAEEDGAGASVIRRVRLQRELVGDLSVADVLQIWPSVVVAHVGAGVHLLQPLRSLSRRQFGAGFRGDAAGERVPHVCTAVGLNAKSR